MPLEVLTVPCLADNYAYVVKGPDGVCLIDAPEAGPIIDALEEKGWKPGVLMITHHHHDHVGGVEELREKYGLKVMGPKAEEGKLPPLDMGLTEGMNGGGGEGYTVPIDVPGHTLGHMAFHFPNAGALFTADSLMALGCGRVFEGTMEQMHDSLQKLAALPPETMVYSGHEYTTGNAKFALTIDPDNTALHERVKKVAAQREAGEPTAQVSLAEELATNPFLRTSDAGIRATLAMKDASDAEVFAEIRRRKDAF
ncbi:hydroxyacylglutathione hydrolase [Oceanicola sp. D3]|uniref:hydroxyacylglutathione hydrolase n=1 Tax=Oceanicola sp. D3 TaxID=2587163 RepID=UPI00111D4A7B|nr:hydroxyacylglutathione hydrolase [Oceanicola sp. D3]QDC10898.1 hydroxyacylglutathione hydrolase [Oceanicola sp. D3]